MNGGDIPELEELEIEYRGLNEGFRIASEKLEAIKKIFEEWNQGGYENCVAHLKNIGFILYDQPSSQEATP